MFKKFLMSAALVTSLVACVEPDTDKSHLDALIQNSINAGIITQGSWYKDRDENIRVMRVVVSTIVPAEARRAAQRVCDRARLLPLKDKLRVEAILIAGRANRPAGACVVG